MTHDDWDWAPPDDTPGIRREMAKLRTIAQTTEPIDVYMRVEIAGARAFRASVPLARNPYHPASPAIDRDETGAQGYRQIKLAHESTVNPVFVWAWGWYDAAMDATIMPGRVR